MHNNTNTEEAKLAF